GPAGPDPRRGRPVSDTLPSADGPPDPPEKRPPPAEAGQGGEPAGGREGARDVAAAYLAVGATLRGAAKAAGVGERTLRRWAEAPDFRRQVRDLRREHLERVAGRLSR